MSDYGKTALLPMSLPAAFRVSHSALRLEDDGSLLTCGLNNGASALNVGPDTSSRKTSNVHQSNEQPAICEPRAGEPSSDVLAQLKRGLPIHEAVGGFVHTPTTKANFTAPSMQKWPSCRNYVRAFGARPITPEQFEFLMGFPIGWTEIQRSATQCSHKSLKRSDEQ